MSAKLSLKSGKKIDHPLAKYNSAGQLFCVLCNAPVKSEIFWTGHINGKAHRDQLQQLKNKKRPAEPNSSEVAASPKKVKVESENVGLMLPPRSVVMPNSKPKQSPPKKKTFEEIEKEEMEMDTNPNQITMTEEDDDEENKDKSSEMEETSVSLPEGFFDDAKEDAKARGKDYKNPEEAEWERFVKEMASEDVKSTALRTADEEDSAKDRELDEIEEQMKNWQRVLELEKKASKVRKQQLERHTSEKVSQVEDDGDEDSDYEEDLDWRSKQY